MNVKILLKLFLISTLILSASHARKLSKSQLRILKIVKSVAKKTPNRHGQTFENTAMAICLAETSAGVFRLGDVTKNIQRTELVTELNQIIEHISRPVGV